MDEVVSTNKKVDKNNAKSNVKKDYITVADLISADMVKNTKKYKDD